MRRLVLKSVLFGFVMLAGVLAAAVGPARAQQGASPQQIQAMIANGQATGALADLHQILQTHPQSGVAWYLVAEAQDATGHADQARQALALAEQYAPGLPFANANDVAALQAHLAAPAARIGFHWSAGLIIGVLVIGFLALRLFSHRRGVPFGYQSGYGAGFAGRPGYPYGPGGMPYGPAGGGMGSSLLGGLAAGAGFAAGERVIDGMLGGNQGGGPFGGQGGGDAGQVPDRDDGLMGAPGWDDNSNNGGGGFDNGGGW